MIELTRDLIDRSHYVLASAAQRFGVAVFGQHTDRDDPILRLFPRVREFTVNDIFRASSLLDYARLGLAFDGDLIECGVFRGGTSVLLALWLDERAEIGRQVHLHDICGGLPAPDRAVDRGYEAGWFDVTADDLRRTLDRFGVTARCVLRPGLFGETLPQLPAGQRFSFAHVDGDLYASTIDCLTHLYPKLAAGAPMVFDDYCDQSGGVMRAVNEHVCRTGEVIHLGPVGQATILKGMTAGTADVPVFDATLDCGGGRHVVTMSTERLARLRPYAALLRHTREELRAYQHALEQHQALCGAPSAFTVLAF